MTDQEVIAELRREVARLKAVVRELTEAMKILTDKDDRAKTFVLRVEKLLSDAEDAKDSAIEARDEAVDALEQEQERQ